MSKRNAWMTLGGVIDQFDRLYPNAMSETVKRRIIWNVDRAFAAETGLKEPDAYSTSKPRTTRVLVPGINKELYWWALLRSKEMDISDGAREYYAERYAKEKQEALAVWRGAKKGGIDLEQFDFYG